jgi:hypothetical protein
VGVFLDASDPNLSVVPPGLDFSPTGRGTDFARLRPGLKQPFFIGDGLTSSMETQLFAVPSGATRLYLGTHDGTGWTNNSGALAVAIMIPEPAEGLLQLGGLMAVMLLRALRHRVGNAPAS